MGCGGDDDYVGKQVGASAFRPIVAGCGDEEFPGRVEVMGIPSGPEHSLPEDKVDVPRLADAETYPQIHLGTYRALAHGLLGRPLGRGYQGDGDGASQPRDGIGVAHRILRVVGSRVPVDRLGNDCGCCDCCG